MSQDFQLKHFSITQKRSAMKVGTDALLLPAWISNLMKVRRKESLKILDVGAGTGIISLMLAQAFPKAYITAVEIDEGASLDARENIDNSPYKDRVRLLNQDFLSLESPDSFDFIVSNPPYFFASSYASEQEKRALARQENSSGMTLYRLMKGAKALLKEGQGSGLFLITPLDREDDLRLYACESLMKASRICRVASKPNKGVRLLSFWTKQSISEDYIPAVQNSLTLHDEKEELNPTYKALLRPFILD